MTLKNASILVIDDDTDVLTAVRLLLKSEVKEVVTEKNPQEINHLVPGNRFDVILLDMNFNSSLHTGNEGLFWLRRIKELKSDAGVIMITAYGDVDLAVRSLKEGASDFVVKPWHNDRLIATIKEVLKKRAEKMQESLQKQKRLLDLSCWENRSRWKRYFTKLKRLPPQMRISWCSVKTALERT